MSFSNTAETAVLEQIFIGTALPWDANTDLWVALYTASPDEAGSATTNEISYGDYARVALDRATEFDITGAVLSNDVLVQFPQCSSGSATATHAAIVTSASGAGTVICYGALSASVPVSTGIQPQFAAGALTFTLD
jgi:hypothetical protein